MKKSILEEIIWWIIMLLNYKVLVYMIIIPIVFYSLDSLNINMIFKKNSVLKARFLYLFLSLALSYLVVGFIYDFFAY